MNRELQPTEKFMTYVRQLDFHSKEQEKEEEDVKNAEDYKWHKKRLEVNQHLGIAHAHLRHMVDLLTMVGAKKHCTVLEGAKPPASEKEVLDQLLFQIASKKKQLQSIQEKLVLSVAGLKENVSINKRYYDEVTTLRKHWKIGSPTHQLDSYHPVYTIDYSFKNDGSKMRVRDLPVTKNDFGNAELTTTTSLLNKTLQIGTDKCSIIVPTFSFDETKVTDLHKPVTIRVEGDVACHGLLNNLQESLFSTDIFTSLSRAAFQDNALIQLLENDIKFETSGPDSFFVRLLSQKSSFRSFGTTTDTGEGNLFLDAGSVGSMLGGTPGEGKPSDSPSSNLSKREKDELVFKIVAVYLHQLMRANYCQKQDEDHEIKLSKDFLRASKVDLEIKLMTNMLDMYRYLKLENRVRKKIEKMSREIPFLVITTLNITTLTPAPKTKLPVSSRPSIRLGKLPTLVSAFDLIYDNRSIITVTVHKNKVQLANIDCIESPSELVSHVTNIIICRTIDTIFGTLSLFLSSTNIVKKPVKVIAVLPDKTVLKVKQEPSQKGNLFNLMVTITQNDQMLRHFNWKSLPGDSNEDKTVRLLLTLMEL
eukprot:TRINITY_DN10009_c0_g1_i2.p1 TRINITY_DN10009_c0_g1~~TRINITY_DN10009_c0_g1_i2.p1  ORF type:complete len:590 (+),score=113.93 TRINITY_DN10009_c0_g1_i2:494-2263(+)